jgi:ABC-type sugar transport system ATPase subunit
MILVEDLSLAAGSFRLSGISFEVPAGMHGVLMGRTGSGKTTLLEAICGLRPLTGGRITLEAGEVTDLPPGRRGIGFVPQEATLFPTKTVREQLGFGPRMQGWPAAEVERRTSELADMLGLGALLNRKPEGLSGGERQRVALGRAIAARPVVLCLDEPLSALDEGTRVEIREVIQRVVREHRITVLHITHSREEARAFGDRLFLLDDGKLSTFETA